jgi:2-oxoglutarate ferredoxin oxidoreductase subunit alpha
MNKKEQVTTVLFGGQAGDGVREAGINFGRLLTKLGYSVIVTASYPSLIRGGHNFTRVTFSNEEVYSDYSQVDVLVGFNSETITLHQKELKKSGLIIFDQIETTIKPSKNTIGLPITKTAKIVGATPIMRSSLALGALCEYFKLSLNTLEETFTETFKNKAELNISLAREGFNIFKNLKINLRKDVPLARLKNHNLLSGNQASAEGLMKAGLDAYIAYPMTPASSIQDHLAKRAHLNKIKVVQPESEVAVINLALGSSFAGAKTAIGTSGGGFALCQEAFSLAGMTEIPLVVLEVQRPGPATGMPTATGQGDLDFVRHAGHGEFPRLILSAGDQVEAYELSALALNLTWKYQLPVIVLTDKHLAESFSNVSLPTKEIKLTNFKHWSGKGNYQRYALTNDGISPLAFPGTKNTVVKTTSYEHDEFGLSTEDSAVTKIMQDKRFKKLSALKAEKIPRFKVFGNKQANTTVIFWGSTKGTILEALKYLTKPVKLIQVLCLEPFATTEFLKLIQGSKKIITVEGNHSGQLANLIQGQTGVLIKNRILRYDGLPFEPIALAKELTKKI